MSLEPFEQLEEDYGEPPSLFDSWSDFAVMFGLGVGILGSLCLICFLAGEAFHAWLSR